MGRDHRAGIRMAAYANMALGVLALGSVLLADNRNAGISTAGFVGAGLLVWGAVEAWAARSGRLRGTMLLALFMAVIGMALIGMPYFVDSSIPFRVATTVIGILVVLVSVADAIMSPDEKRRGSFEPRRSDDAARPPTL